MDVEVKAQGESVAMPLYGIDASGATYGSAAYAPRQCVPLMSMTMVAAVLKFGSWTSLRRVASVLMLLDALLMGTTARRPAGPRRAWIVPGSWHALRVLWCVGDGRGRRHRHVGMIGAAYRALL
jgi:hypothetical protein